MRKNNSCGGLYQHLCIEIDMLAMRKVIQGAGRSLSSMAVKDLKLGSAAAAGSVAGSDVLIKMIASPINAMDVSTSKSGSEGVGMVAAMGDKVTGLREGDWVLPPLGTGAWASEIVMESSKLMRVSLPALSRVWRYSTWGGVSALLFIR